MEPVKEPPKSMVDILIIFLINAVVDILLFICKGSLVIGSYGYAYTRSLVIATPAIIKFISIAVLIMVRNLVAWVLMGHWLDSHLPTSITDRIHNFLHYVGHRGDLRHETHHQTIARLEEEKAKMAQENTTLSESKQRTEAENEELRNEAADLRRDLAEETRQKEEYKKDAAEATYTMLGEAGQKERLQETLDARDKELKEIEADHTRQARNFQDENRALEDQVKDLRARLDFTNVRDESKINNLAISMKKQDRKIAKLERQAEESTQAQITYFQSVKERFGKHHLAWKMTQANLNKKIERLQAEIKDFEKGAEEMGDQVATDMLEKEMLEDGLKEEKSRACAAEKTVSNLTVTKTGLQEKLNEQEGEITTLQKGLQEQKSRADGAEKMISDLAVTKTSLQEKLNEQEGELAALQKGLEEQKSRAGGVEKMVGDLVVTNTDLREKLDEQSGELTALQAKQSSIGVVTAWADAAEAKITSLEAAKADLEERLREAEEGIARYLEEHEMESGCLLM
ncbi:MAG: hypothetical protein Q9211_003999 [Gyalolechia sp. 1 TL-2023]